MRLRRKVILMLIALFLSMAIGMWGYRYFIGASWLDSFYNVSMILSGVGGGDSLVSAGGKIFVALMALYGAVFLLSIIGVLMGDIVQRNV